jgi:hypothetical protein
MAGNLNEDPDFWILYMVSLPQNTNAILKFVVRSRTSPLRTRFINIRPRISVNITETHVGFLHTSFRKIYHWQRQKKNRTARSLQHGRPWYAQIYTWEHWNARETFSSSLCSRPLCLLLLLIDRASFSETYQYFFSLIVCTVGYI